MDIAHLLDRIGQLGVVVPPFELTLGLGIVWRVDGDEASCSPVATATPVRLEAASTEWQLRRPVKAAAARRRTRTRTRRRAKRAPAAPTPTLTVPWSTTPY